MQTLSAPLGALLGACLLALASSHASQDSGDCPQAPEEDLEALLASTFLLQAGLRQTRGAAQAAVDIPGPFLRVRHRRDIEFLSHGHRRDIELLSLDGNSTDSSEDPQPKDLWPLIQMVNSALNSTEDDPVWANAHELIRRYLLQTKDAQQFVRLCEAGEFEAYAKKGCADNSAGQVRINGIPADSFYCGSQRKGIDWSKAYGSKVNNLCKAEAGSAYSSTGVCGSLSKKQLVLNFLQTVPKWKENPMLVNVPSIDCILGLGDCDIYYCQHCSSVCPASE